WPGKPEAGKTASSAALLRGARPPPTTGTWTARTSPVLAGPAGTPRPTSARTMPAGGPRPRRRGQVVLRQIQGGNDGQCTGRVRRRAGVIAAPGSTRLRSATRWLLAVAAVLALAALPRLASATPWQYHQVD